MALEEAGVALIAQGASAYIGDLRNAENATNDFVGTTQKGSSKLGDLAGAFGGLGKAILGAGIGLSVTAVAGIGAAALNTASQVDQASNDMQAALGLTEQEANRLGDVALEVWGNNWYSSIEEAGQAVGLIRQQLGPLSDDLTQKIAGGMAAIQDTFGADAPQIANAIKAIRDNFPGTTEQQALDMITVGFQKGLNSSGDFLDSITEYSTQFGNGGATAEQFFSTLETGLSTGVLGTDKAGDLFKEFVVRIQDGSTLTKDSLTSLGLNADQVLSGLADGTIEPIDAFNMVQKALRETDDQSVVMQAGVGLLGTQFEDLGASAVLAVDTMSDSFADVAGATDTLNAKYDNWPSMWEGIKRSALVAIEPLGDKLLDLANDIMPIVQVGFDWLKNDLPPLIDGVVDAIDTGVAFITDLFQGTLAPALDDNAAFFQETFGTIQQIVTDVASIVQIALGALAGFIEEHGALIERVLSNAWENIKAVIDIAVTLVSGTIRAFLQILQGDWSGAWESIKEMSARIVTDLGTIIGNGLDSLLGIFQELTGGVQKSWDQMIDDALTAGSQLVAGIKKGVQDAWDSFIDWLVDMAGDALDAIFETWGIDSPAAEFVPAGEFAVMGIMQGFQNQWSGFMKLVDKLGEDAIDKAAKLGRDVQSAIADSFSSTASIDRQIADNLDALADVLPDYQQYTQGALKAAEQQARAFLDPEEGAKFFKLRSDQILEYAQLQQDLAEAEDQAERDRIQARMLLINAAQQKELDAFNANLGASLSGTEQLMAELQAVMTMHATDEKGKDISLPGITEDPTIRAFDAWLKQMMNYSPFAAWTTPTTSLPMNPTQQAMWRAASVTNNYGGNSYSMPVYTNNSPEALQSSFAVMASMI